MAPNTASGHPPRTSALPGGGGLPPSLHAGVMCPVSPRAQPSILRSQTRWGDDLTLLRSLKGQPLSAPHSTASAQLRLEGCGTSQSSHASSTLTITQLQAQDPPQRPRLPSWEQMYRRIPPASKPPHKWHQMVSSADHLRLLTTISQQTFRLCGVACSREWAGVAGSSGVRATAPLVQDSGGTSSSGQLDPD